MVDATSVYGHRPWLALYDEAMLQPLGPVPASPLVSFDRAVAAHPDRIALAYFDGRLSYAEVDRLARGFTAHLQSEGFAPGDRLAIILQNVPQFVVALLGAWRAGGTVVPVNPMLRRRELRHVFGDAGVRAIVCSRHGWRDQVADAAAECGISLCFTTSERDLQWRDDLRVLPEPAADPVDGEQDLLEVAGTTDHMAVTDVAIDPADIALISYTSGTSGPPKGAMNTHGNLSAGAALLARRGRLPEGSTLFSLAPLFHITGMVCQVASAIELGGTLALTYRFHPAVVLDALLEHRPAYMVGPSTAYIALLSDPGVTAEHFSSFALLYAGGAPLPPAVVEEFRRRFGQYIRNGYGLTETSAGCVSVPVGREAPVDPTSGTLSVGIPVPGADVRILDDQGGEVPIGDVGEISVRSPTVVPGYWGRPDETARAMPGGELRTGDVGFMDRDGWVYVVDRKKDMIVASGFKVWPREVEDVLYTHPAVREAAVVGVPDDYRGESVKAYVSLRPGATATPDELIAHCREELAAYKSPHAIEVLDELPKTATGKILRRELRQVP